MIGQILNFSAQIFQSSGTQIINGIYLNEMGGLKESAFLCHDERMCHPGR